ncbi:hypothetical protein Tco_0910843 [Tanacetum coccineum]|uniref:Uncharacterized protein n=1 Tax=Tanacetum coccineum TaxID=301880 RepID=A0ABQ5CX78_9ASTR
MEDPRESFNELMDTPLDFLAFVMNRLKVDTLTPELLVGPTFELMKGSCKSLVELEYFLEEVYKTTTDQLDWINPESQQYPHDLRKPLSLIPNSRGKLTNLAVEECIAFNISLRMFTRSIIIQRCVEDLQLGVKSYQKELNLIKPDTYRSDLKRREAYSAYSNPRGFIYLKKHKKNRLMRIDELHKFSDGTLNDVRTALNDRLKGIRMEYLPQTIWRQSDKDKAGAIIQAIDKQLKTRRIMRSLEKFVGGRPYEGDFRLLQRTIRYKMDSMHSTLSMYYDYGTHVKGELLMEILLESTSNKLKVGDLCDSIRMKLVATGKKRWCDSIRNKLVPGYELMIDDEL